MNPNSLGRSISRARLALVLPLLAAAACGRDAAPEGGPRVAISVQALSLAGVGNALWTITVKNGAGATVWTKSSLGADQYGDGKASLSYVGPCDPTANDNTVELV